MTTWTPQGSQTASKAPGRAGPISRAFPQVLSHGRGAFVWDDLAEYADGRYIDGVCSLAAVSLGHADPRVVVPVSRALQRGSLLSLPTRLEGEASERLCTMTGTEQARWVKTGSEAVEAAVRIARCATGRDRILTPSVASAAYHGWHSWYVASKPYAPGVPEAYADVITPLPYGELEPWREQLAGAPVAAVLLEAAPIRGVPDEAFVQGLVTAAHAAGALVIFDEIVWGFRLSSSGAGAGASLGIVPDLACYGKALGNGIPVAAVVGPRDLMQHARWVSGTYGGDTLGLAAACAVMEVYDGGGVIETLWTLGQRLMTNANDLFGAYALPLRLIGYPVHPVFAVDAATPDAHRLIVSRLLDGLAARGVLWHPGGLNVMLAHGADHEGADVLAWMIRAVDATCAALRAERDATGTLDHWDGTVYQDAFTRPT